MNVSTRVLMMELDGTLAVRIDPEAIMLSSPIFIPGSMNIPVPKRILFPMLTLLDVNTPGPKVQ